MQLTAQELPEYMTRHQATKLLGVTRWQLVIWVANGAIHEYKPKGGGGHKLLKTTEIQEAMQILPIDEGEGE